MALLAASLVERREAPHPYVIGVRVPPHKARGGPDWSVRALRYWARRLPALHSLVFEGDGKKGKGGPGSPKKVKSPGSVALAWLFTPQRARRTRAHRSGRVSFSLGGGCQFAVSS